MKIFFDSSTFTKRYINERGSNVVDDLCAKASQLAISIICVPEVISALTRQKRESKLTLAEYRKCKQALIDDIKDITICLLTPMVITESLRVLENSPTRGMDAIHIGCALEWQPAIFVSSDQQQLAAAKQSGLKILAV